MPRLRPFAALVSLGAVLSAGSPLVASAQDAPRTGREVLDRMHAAYSGRWYRTLTFVQRTTITKKDGGTEVQTWHESLRATPDGGTRLRIDFGDLALGNGVIYTADSVYVVRGGKVVAQRPDGNPFLPLIEGVYVQPVERTVRDLAGTKVDLNTVSSGVWHGRPSWIVGAVATDSSAPQFWVDRERLVLVRMILAVAPGQPMMDIDLGGYAKVGQGWLATKIAMSVGGKPAQAEEYSDWKVGMDLSPALFEAASWSTAPHWAKP